MTGQVRAGGGVRPVDQHHDGLEATAVQIDDVVERRPDLEHPRSTGERAAGVRCRQVHRQKLVAVADLDDPRQPHGSPPLGERTRRRPFRHAPARQGDHETVQRQPGEERHVPERSQRERPGGVLPLQAPGDEQAADAGRGGRRAYPRKRRRSNRRAVLARAQRQRFGRGGIRHQLEVTRRKLLRGVRSPTAQGERPPAGPRMGAANPPAPATERTRRRHARCPHGPRAPRPRARVRAASIAGPRAWANRPKEAPAGACRPSSQPVPGGVRGRGRVGTTNSSAVGGVCERAKPRNGGRQPALVQAGLARAVCDRLGDRVDEDANQPRRRAGRRRQLAVAITDLNPVVARGESRQSKAPEP